MHFLLAAAASAFDFGSLLAQIGLGAIVAAPFVFVWKKAESRADEAQKRSDELVKLMITEFSPALIKSQLTIQESGTALTAAAAAIRELSTKQLDRSQLDQLVRLLNRLDNSG